MDEPVGGVSEEGRAPQDVVCAVQEDVVPKPPTRVVFGLKGGNGIGLRGETTAKMDSE